MTSVSARRLGLAAALTVLSVAAHGQTFHELESVTTIEPASEYLKIALTAHQFCNISRQQQGLPPTPAPVTPSPYVHERIWTVSNGRDFVLRRRTYAVGPAPSTDDLECRWVQAWQERIVIQRGGRTTEIFRDSEGAAEIQRDAFTAPWSLDRPDSYPLRTTVMGLVLRCATPEALAGTGILRPMIGMSEMCIAEPPLFRNEDGFSLLVQSTADASLFGGRGGAFSVLQRVRRYGVFNATDRTWLAETYLTD